MGKLIVKNKKAFFDYEILETIETGIVLKGDEVKSLRSNGASLTGAFATVHDAELYLINCHISKYAQAYMGTAGDPTQRRKLLLQRRQLNRLIGDISRKGITLVPLSLYFNDRNLVKVELGICKHKKTAQKKELIRERDIKRETNRELKNRGF